MSKRFRNNGATGAILDEYELRVTELEHLLSNLTDDDLLEVLNHEAAHDDFKSIQAILTHVVKAGYNYVLEIRKSLGEKVDFVEHKKFFTIDEYISELKKMFKFNEQLFKDYPNLKLEEFDSEKKILVRWGQLYDVEQLLEHAIVHISRHKRQIQKFLIKLKEHKKVHKNY